MQLDEMVVTRRDQARALRDTGFLGRFLEPASPSDVARSLCMPANLAHHHVKRLAALGLLVWVKRERGKVYYQLAAKTFKHHRSLLFVGDQDEQTAVTLETLRERFLAEYAVCDRIEGGHNPNWHVFSFVRETLSEPPRIDPPTATPPSRPAHLQVRALNLSPRRYRELVEQIAALISTAVADEDSQSCTLAFLAMDGPLMTGSTDSHYLSTFVPLQDELQPQASPAGQESGTAKESS